MPVYYDRLAPHRSHLGQGHGFRVVFAVLFSHAFFCISVALMLGSSP
ncbi:hypothetical protein [Caldimonas brevitalea]|uniref:Uncharacterized protein n=1 Tax=Caldimonas brevitalea TaxID=413882 RepID=A0A0G3BJ03_9BURK|nr:hypothetical protein [Caldimonas brevitalea]AKJ27978.1 hypothetical protein AAW51_1287 [Caldimonas brevitalea]